MGTKHHRVILTGASLYFLGVSAFMLHRNVWLSPDQFFIFAMVIAVILGRGRRFIHDWTPFILVILGYEFLRSAIPAITKFPVHSLDLIASERTIFHNLPTIYLQQHFLHLPGLSWYDFVFALSYMSYFIIPLLFAFYAWLHSSPLFRTFAAGFIILHFLAFVTWIFFPAMPPWMASDQQLIPPVTRILYLATAKMTIPGGFPTVYQFIAANPVAAVPSMHAALPTLMILVSFFARKKLLTLISLVYALIVWVGIVYLGEHYAVDALVGVFYAEAAYFLTVIFLHRFETNLLPAK